MSDFRNPSAFFSNEKLFEGDEQGIGYSEVKVVAAGPLGSSHSNSEQNDADLDLVGNGGRDKK